MSGDLRVTTAHLREKVRTDCLGHVAEQTG